MCFRLVLSIEIIMKTPKHLKAWLKFWRRTTLWEHDYRPVWKQWLYKWFEFVSCECGEKRRVLKTDLIKKHSTSCWCYNKDLLKEKIRSIEIVKQNSTSIIVKRSNVVNVKQTSTFIGIELGE